MNNSAVCFNISNLNFHTIEKYPIIFADYVYENSDFSWVDNVWHNLSDKGVFIAMTDFHTQHRYRVYMEDKMGATFVNHLVWKNEWGNHPKNKFHQCYDDVIIYSKSDWKFYPEKIQIDKVTKGKGLNPSGRETKTATAWIDDAVLTTVAKERVKKADGHLIRWQKPLKLYDRIIAPFVDPGDTILDLFMGSGSLGAWSILNNMNYIGIENDKEVFELALKNIESHR